MSPCILRGSVFFIKNFFLFFGKKYDCRQKSGGSLANNRLHGRKKLKICAN